MSTVVNPTCPHGKMGFKSKQAALRSVSSIRQHQRHPPGFAYECGTCGSWHLTNQSPQNRRARAKAAWRAVGHRNREEST